MNEFLKETYQMKLMIQVSRVHSGQEELPDCLQDIQMEQEYRNSIRTKSADILFPADIQYSQGELEYLEHCQKVSQLLEEHEIEKALQQLSEMAAKASRQKQKKSSGGQSSGLSETDRMIEQVTGYIREHYEEHTLTVSLIAEEFSVGITYLSREFKRRNESGILEYINHLRLERAKQFIKEGCTIKEAASRVGFFDTQPLIRLFRQIDGMTPSEYRNRMLKNDNGIDS